MNTQLNQWINNLYRHGAIDTDVRDDLKWQLNVQCAEFAAVARRITAYIQYMPATYQARWADLLMQVAA